MELTFDYSITYEGDDKVYDRTGVIGEVDNEMLYKVIRYIKESGREMDCNEEGLSELFCQLREKVTDFDRLFSKKGYSLKSPLKKPRRITSLSFMLSERDYHRLLRVTDPEVVFSRKKESIRIYRNNGSYITVTSEGDTVRVSDSLRKGTISMQSEDFIRQVVWWN